MTLSPDTELRDLAGDPGFQQATADLTERWRARDARLQDVEAILRFIEVHPDLDYGLPGPLIHFAEQFHGRGYEQLLLQSIERRPTVMSAWMLNRLMNGTQDDGDWQRFARALQFAASRDDLDPAVRNEWEVFAKGQIA